MNCLNSVLLEGTMSDFVMNGDGGLSFTILSSRLNKEGGDIVRNDTSIEVRCTGRLAQATYNLEGKEGRGARIVGRLAWYIDYSWDCGFKHHYIVAEHIEYKPINVVAD
jgi:hypothetical protein